ncbi:taurine dioxygenase [Halalkalibaculum sp. DA384]|uniref:taurine dioxygenase n=1 Tax=Halalkalibaculum sp. DA384 TaxID=3373606 RepID=UPI0037545D2B
MSRKDRTYIDRELIAGLVYNEEAYIKEFADASEDSFTEFKTNYRKYLLKRDETNFRKAGHKIKPVAQMLEIDEIVEEYEHAKTLLWDEKPVEKLEQSVEKIEGICNEIIRELKQIQENPSG